MPVEYEFFPPELIALQKEINLHHPELAAKFGGTQTELPDYLGEIAASVGIVLDSIYSPQDIIRLCDILVRKLQEKRTLIIRLH